MQEIQKHTQKMTNSVNNYANNRNTQSHKAIKDITIGKKGEFLIALWLHKNYKFPFLKPDLNIYSKENKSWSADLPYHKFHKKLPPVHVKTCTDFTVKIANDYSWTFEKKDSIFDLNDDAKDVVALVYIPDEFQRSGIIFCVIPWIELKKNLKSPRLKKHAKTKACIYSQDIIE